MESREKRFATEPLNRLIFSMVLPAFLAQLINALYNIVDRVYIGRIPGDGELALTGLGITFPILQIIAAFSAFSGSGGAPLASRYLGKQEYNKAQEVLLTSVSLLIRFSVILTVFFYITKAPLLNLFGASENTFQYANDYLSIYLLGTIFVQFSVGLNSFISGQGNSKIAMFSVLIGAVTNIILDPIFIFGFNLGVQGAAIATVISQACSAIWIVCFLKSKKSVIKLDFKKLKLKKELVRPIFALGISPFIMQSTNSLVNIVLNSSFEHYGGDIYVGAMTILSSIATVLFIPVDAIRQGVIPILSYNYGAHNKQRVLDVIKRFMIFALTTSLVTGSIVIMFPSIFVSIFSPNPELVNLTSSLAPIFFIGAPFFGILMGTQGCLLSFGLAKNSIIIALLRKIILLIPLALILPHFFGVMGLIYAQPIADIGSILCAAISLTICVKRIVRTM
ncbi:MATE family efflux transporter [Candidatus Epulonipiscioides gigas]|nr:MATE family efflux transporter [Epulopiscium sp. SCG-C07WGA-EpuloA2]